MKNISYNFGAIRDSIAKLSSIELMKENKSLTLDKFIERTSSIPNLKKQQLIYKNIQECKPFAKERLAERFVSQNLSMFKNSKWNDIKFENKQLRFDLLGAPDVSHVEATVNGDLFECINTLIESASNPGFTDFEGEAKSYSKIIDFLTREVEPINESKENDDSPSIGQAWKYITKNAVNNFNDRYEHLNESEKNILSVLMSENSYKSEFLEDIKNENIKIIDKLLEGSDKAQFNTLIEFKDKLEKINNISFDSIDEYILECVELRETLNELK